MEQNGSVPTTENGAETTRSDLSETETRVEEAAEASDAIQSPVLNVSPRDDPEGGVLAKNPYEWTVRCSGVDLTETDDLYLTAYHRFEVTEATTAGSNRAGTLVRLRYSPE